MLLGRELRWLSLREPLERNLAVFVISAALYANTTDGIDSTDAPQRHHPGLD